MDANPIPQNEGGEEGVILETQRPAPVGAVSRPSVVSDKPAPLT